MNPDAASRTGNASTRGQQPRLRTVLVCDLVDSTRLLHRLGDVRGSDLLRRHDRLCRELIGRHHGREIDKSDGFLVLFDRPASAVAFALAYHAAVDALALEADAPLQARVGIHFGELLIWHTDPDTVAAGAAPMSVEGLAKPVAARLAALARPGQTLLSDVARALAERAADAEDGEPGPVRSRAWSALGHYRLKGIAEPLAVHEVAADRRGLRGAPRASDKGRRTGLLSRPVLALAPLLAIAAVALLLGVFGRGTDAVAFSERDWVLIADAENATGDPGFDRVLEAALRLSLEQSRYVNVLPEPQVQESLRRITRDPDARLDPELAVEVALREGVRALLVPSIIARNGQYQIGVDLVEPNSGAVVRSRRRQISSQSEMLAAVDQLATELRSELGEELREIERAARPIEQVATPSVDALRAYTLGVQASAEFRNEAALLHLQQALELDPEFAMAMVSMARLSINLGQRAHALEWLERAVGHRERLSEREWLSLQAFRALASSSPDVEARYRALLALYPDHFPAAHNLALISWYENRFPEALEFARRASAPRSITRAASTYLQGIALTGQGEFEAAQSAFEQAYSLGESRASAQVLVGSYAAQRDFDAAWDSVQTLPEDQPLARMRRRSLELTLLADQGRWAEIDAVAEAMVEASAATDSLFNWGGITSQLAVVRRPEARSELRPRAADVVERGRRALTVDSVDRDVIALAVIYAGLVGAREGDLDLARSALELVAPVLETQPREWLRRMGRVLEARVALDEDGPASTVRLLEPLLDGAEPYLLRVMLYEALSAAGRLDEAIDHAEWVAANRGLAYAEDGIGYQLRVENVIQSVRARIRLADLHHRAGNPEAARRWLEEFEAAWPDVSMFPDLHAEQERLGEALTSS